MRLIDVDSRIAEIRKNYCTGCENYGGVRCRACWVDDAIGLFEDAPTVDAVPVVHGRWEPDMMPTGIEYTGWEEMTVVALSCSECGKDVDVSEGHFRYCPNCGARMDGGGNCDDC